jgi:hypothetical protein
VHFAGNALINYFLNLGLLAFVILFFQTAGEYGYMNQSPYYQPWFRFLELAWYYYGPGLWIENPASGPRLRKKTYNPDVRRWFARSGQLSQCHNSQNARQEQQTRPASSTRKGQTVARGAP